ncbi:unnamed protein product [Porites evermanni]|uniref:Exonuclease domain-containing protein n=1 Tax=Porites evermanni TaxID=104178 RepID=A0ABN8PTY0_9CNID|nr:unnamed protein product [Porites evermanni]
MIVLDFELTCWKDKKMNYGPEIIEFPPVLLNTSTGEMESEFHMFVQPSEHTRLSEFCTELTGITQVQLLPPLQFSTLLQYRPWALQHLQVCKLLIKPHDQILNKDENEPTENLTKWCKFVTWSDWDLGTCLKNECYRK